MTTPQFEQPTDSVQSQQIDPEGDPAPPPLPGEVRTQLVSGVLDAKDEPDLAQQVYQLLGVPNPGVSLRGDQTKVSELQPGDLIGWKGGHEPDGRYIGNIAMYVGPGEILESYYGTTRRRKLGPDENTFGMPVTLNEPGY